MKNRAFFATLMMLSLLLCFRSGTDAQSINPQPVSSREGSVILFENANFGGRYWPFGIGSHRLLPDQGSFNDIASSIKVPRGLVVIVYEHSDEGGGYGEWVDFLEDQPDLSKYGFDKKISHLEIFATRRGSEVYERNKIESGRFVERRWVQANEDPINPDPVVAPSPKPPNIPVITSFMAEPTLIHQGQSTTLRWETAYADRVVIGERYPVRGDAGPQSINWQGAVDPSGSSQKNPAQPTVYVLRAEKGDQSTSKAVLVDIRRAQPTFCSISGSITRDRLSYGTRVELHRTDASQPVRTVRAIAGAFRFERVPVGKYQIVPKAHFPSENDRPSSLWFFPRAHPVTCRPNIPHGLSFRIGSTEG